MSKDAYYFTHDSNARHDPKVTAMRGVYGSEGYGWYWMLIEMLRESNDYKLDMHSKYTFNAFALQLQSESRRVEEFVHDCINEFNLFVSDGKYFWSESLLRRMQYKDEKSEKRRQAANSRWEKARKEQENSEKNANGMQMHCKDDANAMQGKESKRKESKVNIKNNIPEQIENLRLRYSDNQIKIIEAYLEMIRHTRVSAKISPSVILGMYQEWDKHPTICVEYGLKTHTENPAYHSKKENYTSGIIRNTTAEEASERLSKPFPQLNTGTHKKQNSFLALVEKGG